jgi:uncharacterized protein YjbI with pentapeptide repeats
MANQEQLERLRQGANVWNAWRKEQDPNFHPDLSGANLGGADLGGADLSGARLSEANLSVARLMGADLRRADLRGAHLRRPDLRRAHLNGVYLRGVRLRGADLSGALLRGTHLSEADLSGAHLSEADLRGADLNKAHLSGAHLNKADLSGANLSGANLSGADLSGADLSGADLSGATLTGADLTGAIFTRAMVGRTVFGDIDLRTVKGLETLNHRGPSTIGTDTIERSHGDLPEVFLRQAGLGETFITYTRSLVAKPIEYYTCLLSYSSKDQDFAERLYTDLQSEGVRCWYSPADLHIGEKIGPHIDETTRLYDKLIVVLSQDSIASSWVAYEVAQAMNKESAGIPNVLYPIRLDEAVMTCMTWWAEDIKRTRHISDFERWQEHHEYQKSFQRLLRALRQSRQAT